MTNFREKILQNFQGILNNNKQIIISRLVKKCVRAELAKINKLRKISIIKV